MKTKLIVLSLCCGLSTLATAEESSESPAKDFKLPTQLINPEPQPVSKQDVFDSAALNSQFSANATAMKTLPTDKEVRHIAKTTETGVLNESDFPGYVDTSPLVKSNTPYSFLEIVKSKYKPTQEFKDLEPGSNIAIPVAVGLTNPIITNFKMIAVRTHDEESVMELEDGRLYITINSLKPVALMLFEEGVPESMVNVTLVPMEAMPVIVNLDINLSKEMKYKGNKHRIDLKEQEAKAKAEQSEIQPNFKTDTARISRIKQILKPVGRGEIPRGFTLSHDVSLAMKQPCGMTIEQRVMQRIVGTKEVVDVVRVKNNTTRPYSMREQMCESRNVMAVAIYNKSLLQPGEATEVYILRDKTIGTSRTIKNNSRPRVVNM